MPDEERKLLDSDEDIERGRRKTAFNVERIARYAILVMSLIFAAAVLFVVVDAVLNDPKWRDFAIRAVFDGLPGITVAILAILGVNKGWFKK